MATFERECFEKNEEIRLTICHMEELAAFRQPQAVSVEPAVYRGL